MTKKYTTRRHVRLTGPMSEIKEAIRWAYENGYRVHRSGPKVGADLRVTGRYLITASKEISP